MAKATGAVNRKGSMKSRRCSGAKRQAHFGAKNHCFGFKTGYSPTNTLFLEKPQRRKDL